MHAQEPRTPPYSPEAEKATLGAVFVDNAVLGALLDLLEPMDFYVTAHRLMFESMVRVSSQGLPTDPVTVGNDLKDNGNLEKAGGVMAISELMDAVAVTANVEHYAAIVREKAAIRRVISTSQSLAAEGLAGVDDVTDYLDAAERAIHDATNTKQSTDYVSFAQSAPDVFKSVEQACQRGDRMSGHTSGFDEIDKMTNGFRKGELIIVAGRPAMGKTTLGVNIATNLTQQTGKASIVFSLEMGREELVKRVMCSEGGINAQNMRSNNLSPDDMRKMVKVTAEVSQHPIYFFDKSPMTPYDIRSKSRRLAKDHDLGVIVVDYLQLMSSRQTKGGGRQISNREQEIADISRSMKSLAKELEVPVIALSQLNRGLESRPDKRPKMSDLRESGAIEQDADLIMFVYRDEVYHPDTDSEGIAEIIIAKQRSGPIGTVKLKFWGQYNRFDNLAEQPSQPNYPPENPRDGY